MRSLREQRSIASLLDMNFEESDSIQSSFGPGLREDEPARSWNSSHPSRGCSQENLRSTGGAGLFYCFAAN
jgi:hypothetical protein